MATENRVTDRQALHYAADVREAAGRVGDLNPADPESIRHAFRQMTAVGLAHPRLIGPLLLRLTRAWDDWLAAAGADQLTDLGKRIPPEG